MPRLPHPVKRFPHAVLLPILGCLALTSTSCGVGAYFNTYYNARKVFSEAETELLAQQDPKRTDQAYLAPYTVPGQVKNKFTSVIEKCSKLLQYYPESNLVDDALLMIGRSYYYQNEHQAAERKFRELITGYPSSDLVPEARILLANTLYRAKRTDDATLLAREIAEEAERTEDLRTLARASMLLGTIELEAKNLRPAREQFERAAEFGATEQDRFSARVKVAEIDMQLEDFESAGRAFERALDDAPTYVGKFRAGLGRARVLARIGAHQEALDNLTNLLADINNREFYGEIDFEIGNVYRDMGDLRLAVEQYRFVDTAYARTEIAAKSYYELGLLYEKELLLYDSARVTYTKGKSEFGLAAVTPLLTARSDFMNRYFTLLGEIAKNESLRTLILAPPDSLFGADSLGTSDSLRAAASPRLPDSLRAVDRPALPPEEGEIVSDPDAHVRDSTLASSPPAAQAPPVGSDTSRSSGIAAGGIGDTLSRPGRRTPPVTVPLDTVNARLAAARGELGALFYSSLERPDSATFWFRLVLQEHPGSPQIPRALYTLAQISARDSLGGRSTADSLYTILADSFAATEFGVTAARLLGRTAAADSTDAVAELYTRGESLLSDGKHAEAISTFTSIIRDHPSSALASKAQYAVGWIYERVEDQPDSAIAHYRLLLEQFPKSQYATLVKPKLDAVEAHARELEARAKAEADSLKQGSEPVETPPEGKEKPPASDEPPPKDEQPVDQPPPEEKKPVEQPPPEEKPPPDQPPPEEKPPVEEPPPPEVLPPAGEEPPEEPPPPMRP